MIYWQPHCPDAVAAAVSPQQMAFADGAQQLCWVACEQQLAADHVVSAVGASAAWAGLVARTIAPCMPGAASWVKLTSAPTNPAAASVSKPRARAPAR